MSEESFDIDMQIKDYNDKKRIEKEERYENDRT